ncbi:MAG: RNase H-like domain-containing protein, partial [Nitrosomonadaceae bacterium]
LDLKTPENASELATFLGTTNFYMRFVPGYANIVEPLRILQRKNAEWEWGEKQKTAFETLKEKLSSKPLLAHFDVTCPTIVTCDASGYAVGSVMSQIQDGVERPVAFSSKTLSTAERKYSTSEREALACVYACEHWHFYLYCRRFLLRTDHQALKTLLTTSGTGHRPLRLYRWSDRLYQYNFGVEYIKGVNNCVADMLSRLTNQDPVSDANGSEISIESELLKVFSIFDSDIITPDKLKSASDKDVVISKVVRFLHCGRWPSKVPEYLKPYYRLRDELSIFNGCCVARGDRAIIPENLQHDVLSMAHEGHPGIVRMKQLCRDSVWWPNIDGHIETKVKSCTPCIISEKSVKPRDPPLQPIPWPTRPWEVIKIDIFGEVKVAPAHQRFIFTIHDVHSKWPEIIMCHSFTTPVVIKALKSLSDRWGDPKNVISDNGPQFIAHEFKSYLKSRGIEHVPTTYYNPQSNGVVERFHRVLKEGLKAHMAEGLLFGDSVQSILRLYRRTVHATTGKTPAELMIGRKLEFPLYKLRPGLKSNSRDEVVNGQKRVEEKQAKMKRYTDCKRGAKAVELAPGDRVRVLRPRLTGQHKLSTHLSEPKIVKRQIGKYSYRMTDGTKWKVRRIVRDSSSEKVVDDSFTVPVGIGDNAPLVDAPVVGQQTDGRGHRDDTQPPDLDIEPTPDNNRSFGEQEPEVPILDPMTRDPVTRGRIRRLPSHLNEYVMSGQNSKT